MIKYLKNVLTGIISHWNQTNNLLVNDLWDKTRHMNEYNKIVLNEFIVASNVISQNLFGPNRQSLTMDKLKDKDIKELTRQDLRPFYTMTLTTFCSLYKSHNPDISDTLFNCLNQLMASQGVPMIANGSTDLKGHTEEIINRGIDKISNSVQLLMSDDPVLRYGLTTLVMTLYTKSAENIEEQLGLKK